MNLQDAQLKVADFMIAAGQEVKGQPRMVTPKVHDLRLKLHSEEAVKEYLEAYTAADLVLIADSLADSLVVILGTACAYGIDITSVFNEVMDSNMTKFTDGHRREDGKWIKGPGYRPADIRPILVSQGAKL